MYDPKSLRAEEFISDEEIRQSLDWAEKNKENKTLIDNILEKSQKLPRPESSGSFRAAGLRTGGGKRKIFALAEQIKKDFYGNRIVLSRRCISTTASTVVYCPYHGQNKHIPPQKLTQEEVRRGSHCSAGHGPQAPGH